MVEAVAQAAALPVADVRRAVMVSGDLGTVAEAALGEGAAGLQRFALALFRPLQPMLAQPAEDIADALAPARPRGARVQARRRARPGAQGGRRGARLHPPPERGHRRGAGGGRGGRARCRREAPSSTARRSRCARTAGRSRSRSPCAASAASWTSRRCARSCRCAPFFFDCLALDGEALIDRPAEERFAALAAAAAGAAADPAPGHRSRGRGRRPSSRRRWRPATRA